MKLFKFLALVFALLMFLCACGSGTIDQSADPINIVGKPFLYDGEGAGGDFVIYFAEDGTFNYYEGTFSSHIGMGTYTIEGDRVTMSGDLTARFDPDTGKFKGYERTFVFRIGTDAIFFIADGSDQFSYVKVPDGGKFTVTEIGEE